MRAGQTKQRADVLMAAFLPVLQVRGYFVLIPLLRQLEARPRKRDVILAGPRLAELGQRLLDVPMRVANASAATASRSPRRRSKAACLLNDIAFGLACCNFSTVSSGERTSGVVTYDCFNGFCRARPLEG